MLVHANRVEEVSVQKVLVVTHVDVFHRLSMLVCGVRSVSFDETGRGQTTTPLLEIILSG